MAKSKMAAESPKAELAEEYSGKSAPKKGRKKGPSKKR